MVRESDEDRIWRRINAEQQQAGDAPTRRRQPAEEPPPAAPSTAPSAVDTPAVTPTPATTPPAVDNATQLTSDNAAAVELAPEEIPVNTVADDELQDTHSNDSRQVQPPNMYDVVSYLLDNRITTDKQQYHLVVLPEDDHTQLESFSRIEELAGRIRDLIRQAAAVELRPFMGTYLPITKGPHRFLITPLGPIPLFDVPTADSLQIEEHGYIGPADPNAAIPQTETPPQAEVDLSGQLVETEISEQAGDDDDTPTMPISSG